jgi:hypothetical protein
MHAPPKETDKAWAAGFFDGEGSCGYYPKSRHISLAIGQSDEELLMKFQGVVGVGSVRTSYRESSPTKTFAMYRVTNERDINIVLELLWDYLGEVKRNQILNALIDFDQRPSKGSKYDRYKYEGLHSKGEANVTTITSIGKVS